MEFVEQLQAGQVPSVIQDLPQEAVQEFRNVIKIALSLPTEILDAAEAAATRPMLPMFSMTSKTVVSSKTSSQSLGSSCPTSRVDGLTSPMGLLMPGTTLSAILDASSETAPSLLLSVLALVRLQRRRQATELQRQRRATKLQRQQRATEPQQRARMRPRVPVQLQVQPSLQVLRVWRVPKVNGRE